MKLRMAALLFSLGLAASASAENVAPDAKTTTEQFGDWQLLCNQVGEEERCRITQQLTNPQGQVVSVVNVFEDANSTQVFEVALPLMVDLVKPVMITIDDQAALEFPYNLCNAQACFVLISDNGLISGFKSGGIAEVTFRPISAKEAVTVNYSLKGFSRALQALETK